MEQLWYEQKISCTFTDKISSVRYNQIHMNYYAMSLTGSKLYRPQVHYETLRAFTHNHVYNDPMNYAGH